ncbi:1-acyl-sn-glycerol-3-phosphate acyltransferase [Psychroserpens sp. MEBiC05023]
MKQLWLFSVRAYLRLGLFFYFKKIEVANANVIPKDKSVLFLANHQNALLDALLIATKNGRFSYFLTRAAVFKKPMVSRVLKSLQMLPVYRIRDGWGNLTKNNSIFSKSSELLSQNEAVVIFPEGSHNLKRTVRPLSKGFTRIVFETLERYPETELHLIPVGLNFQHATQFSDSVLINFGTPMLVNSDVLKHENNQVSHLKSKVALQLRQLTTHVDTNDYDKIIQQLHNLNVDFTKPEAVNACIASNFKFCKQEPPNRYQYLKKVFKILLIINLCLPYVIWKFVAQPKIKEIEFTSTFRFAIAITLVPLFIIFVMLSLGLILHLKFALMYLFNVFLLALLSIKL